MARLAQKKSCKEICTDMVKELDAQSMDWKTQSLSMEKVCQSKSKFKARLIVFLMLREHNFGRMGCTGHNNEPTLLLEVLTKLRESKKYQNYGCENSFMLHQDNVFYHTALPEKWFLTNKHITTLEHPIYLPDLAP